MFMLPNLHSTYYLSRHVRFLQAIKCIQPGAECIYIYIYAIAMFHYLYSKRCLSRQSHMFNPTIAVLKRGCNVSGSYSPNLSAIMSRQRGGVCIHQYILFCL